MVATAGAYGLKPSNMLGGQYRTGAFDHLPIASAYDTNIFTGDLVTLLATGVVAKDAGTTACTPVGIFVGCQYTDTSGQWLQHQYWPADQVATDAQAFVVTDPDVVFMIQADATVAAADIGLNFALVQGAGNTSTGNSGVTLDADTLATTNTLPVRLLGFAAQPDNAAGDAFPNCLVKWNVGHQYTNTEGL